MDWTIKEDKIQVKVCAKMQVCAAVHVSQLAKRECRFQTADPLPLDHRISVLSVITLPEIHVYL